MKYLPLLFLITACSEMVRAPVEVKVPVVIPCRVDEPAEPHWPTLAIKLDTEMFEKARATLAELELRKGYETPLLAAIRGCQ